MVQVWLTDVRPDKDQKRGKNLVVKPSLGLRDDTLTGLIYACDQKKSN